MKLYTRTGDDGTTALYGAERTRKTSLRVEAYGTVDELSSLLGVCRAQNAALAVPDTELAQDLTAVQNDLYHLGADLATRSGSPYEQNIRRIAGADVTRLETLTDRWHQAAPPLKHFVHPAGTLLAAHLHLARTVARRAERDVLRLAEQEAVNPQAQAYLNRLSDLLFALARAENARRGVAEETLAVQPR